MAQHKMSLTHLEKLRNNLTKHKWVIQQELPGDDYRISAIWRISRPDKTGEFKLAFDGMDDMEVLPIEKSYGCHVISNEHIDLYFGRKSFAASLTKFMIGLSKLEIRTEA